jgi:phage terminase large subunit-like protein
VKLKINPDALAQLDPVQRRAVEVKLLELEDLRRANPLVFYEPHPKQVEFHSSREPLKCFLGGNRSHVGSTLVRMADGSVREIDKIRRGDRVVGVDVEGNCSPCDVLEVFCNGFAPCKRFVFGRGNTEVEVSATPEHRVVMDRFSQGPRVVPLGVAEPRSGVVRALGFEPETEGEHEEFAMLLGLLLGDGSFTDRGVRGRVCVFHNTEDDLMALMRDEAASVALRLSPRISGESACLVAERPSPRGWFLDFAQDVLGLDCNAHEKQMPDCVWTWSNEAVGRLLAGLFLTDGWVEKGRRVGIQLTSPRLIEEIRELLEVRFGVYGGATKRRIYPKATHRDAYTLCVSSLPCLARFRDAVPLIGRKRAELDRTVATVARQHDSRLLRFRESYDLGEQLVWDLKVAHPDSMFLLANGVVTHNSGKTTAGMIDDLIQALDRESVPDHLKGFKFRDPPFFCRIVIPDLTNTLDKVVLQKVRDWCPPSQLKGGSVEQAWQDKMRVLTFKNGSYFQFFSNDQDVDKFGGAALHRIHYDEEPREDIRKESLMRLIDYGGDELFTMTPLQGLSWTYTDIFEPWEKGELEEATVITVDMDDNPHLNEATKVRVLSGLTAEERKARKSGLFVHFAGLIYPKFSTERHVVPELVELPNDPIVPLGGIDNGIRNMAGVLLTFLDPDDVLWVFDELPIQGKTVAEVAGAFNERWAYWQCAPRWTIIDPASRRREEQTGKSIRDAYREAGVMTIVGLNDHLTGFNAVKERLETDRLKVTANCTELIREFRKYRWRKESSRSDDAPKEAPIRKDDHLLDALRYICLSPMVCPKRPPVNESETMKDRLLREHLAQISRPRIEHPSGPGVFA